MSGLDITAKLIAAYRAQKGFQESNLVVLSSLSGICSIILQMPVGNSSYGTGFLLKINETLPERHGFITCRHVISPHQIPQQSPVNLPLITHGDLQNVSIQFQTSNDFLCY